MVQKPLPEVDRHPPFRDHVIDEMAVPCTQFEDAVAWLDEPGEIALLQGAPQHVAPLVLGESRIEIGSVASHCSEASRSTGRRSWLSRHEARGSCSRFLPCS